MYYTKGLDEFNKFIKNEILTFYGVCGNEFKLNDQVFEAIEDPEDGYRSCLDCINKKDSNGIFFDLPLAAVKIVIIDDNSFDGYEITDIFTNHVWLKVGTEVYDSYYPYFVFEYTPDKSQTI